MVMTGASSVRRAWATPTRFLLTAAMGRTGGVHAAVIAAGASLYTARNAHKPDQVPLARAFSQAAGAGDGEKIFLLSPSIVRHTDHSP
jgi:hypothetical protein